VGVTLAELEDDPHPILARLRATAPVAWLPALDGWLVTRYDLAVRVMRDPRLFTVDDPRFSTARVIGRSMLSTDGAEHARHRDPFAQPFRPAEVRDRFEAFVEALAGELVAAIEPHGQAELRSTVAGPLAVGVVAEALGLEDVPADTVLSWYGAIVEAVSDVTAGRPAGAAGARAFDALRDNVERTIAARRTPSILVDAVRTLRSGEVVSNAAVLMFGGIDTTAGMITNAVRHVLAHPEAREPARGDGIGTVIEESLRLEPTAAVVDRYATRDVELGGAAIRRGDLVVVSIAGANRDPAVFADPDRFDPHRANARLNLAFAQGPHFCLGAQLARGETRIVLRGLLELPGLRLDPAHPHAPRGLVFRRPEQLHVRWEPDARAGRLS
jgi:cytochrome P450